MVDDSLNSLHYILYINLYLDIKWLEVIEILYVIFDSLSGFNEEIQQSERHKDLGEDSTMA